MALILFLFVDVYAVLPELAGSEFPLVPLLDLFCLCIWNLRGETKLKKRWHVILMHGVNFILVC